MNWLLPRHRDPQEPPAPEARVRDDALRQRPDPYSGVPLGVECAWLPSVGREVTRPLA